MQEQRREAEHAGGEVRIQRHGAAAGAAVQVGGRQATSAQKGIHGKLLHESGKRGFRQCH